MTSNLLERSTNVGRRRFIAGIVLGSISTTAGCGNSRTEDQHKAGAADDVQESSNSGGELPKGLQQAKGEIEIVFGQLSNIPIFENDEFVFDVNFFENEFDHHEVKRTAEKAIERIERTTMEEELDSIIEGLITSAEVGRLLVAQRVMTHQIIAAGLTLERQVGRGNYGRGLDVTRTAKQFLENLRKVGGKTEVRISKDQNTGFSIEEYDPTAIKKSQENLVEVVRWSDHVFEAFHQAILGLKKYDEGNTAIESAKYGMAESSYGESEQQFQAAARSFNEAQGAGQQIPHLVHFVEGLRCLIPAYLASSGPLQSSMEEFDAGNEKVAREIVREAISSANEKAARCL